ncbi:hypothetical protein CDAR_7881 [Caerostris darwini]|uniref:Secreted protein n=1 Tax=Caerostris darwini TaxID=1538125 RepID=A0AAV4QCX4_9ARAC|nr:hypothetical protein CDAR_7881 [Caerostris darwini]
MDHCVLLRLRRLLCCFNQASSHATGKVWSKTTQVDPFRCLFSAFPSLLVQGVSFNNKLRTLHLFWLRIKPGWDDVSVCFVCGWLHTNVWRNWRKPAIYSIWLRGISGPSVCLVKLNGSCRFSLWL